MAVKKEGDNSAPASEESEYVRVETKSSRQRESQAYNAGPSQAHAQAAA